MPSLNSNKPQPNQAQTPLVSGLLSASQADQPERIFDVLITSAVKESWINLLIHFHTAIFFGLILLASGYDGITSIIYLAIHLTVSLISSVILVLLIRQTPEQLILNRRWAIYGLTLADILTSLGWGVSILLFFVSSSLNQANTLVVLLLAAGISSAALSAKLLHILIAGRLLVFMPTIVLLLVQQPPDWLLQTTSLTLSFGVSVGVGYAIHVQLLREASVMVQLSETQSQIVHEAEFRERFLKSITHDLRQPLASLKLHFRSLRKHNPSIEQSEELNAIEASLVSANQIMRNVSQLAWINDTLPTPKLQPTSLQATFESILTSTQAIAERKGLSIEIVNTRLFCMAEQSYLERVIRNLVDNAIEHTDSGKILIGARNRLSQGLVEIQVLDTGCGIDQKEYHRVFENYERLQPNLNRDAEHLGLGLSIVKNIGEAMGGSITLASELGRGSCFGLLLPAASTEEPNGADQPLRISSILIVDDDKEYAEKLATAATYHNLRSELITEPNDIDALFNDGLPAFDCYLFDYHLSQTQNGLDLAKLTPAGTKKILISNFDTPQLHQTAAQSGMQILPKPQGEQAIERFLKEVVITTG